MCVYIFSCNNLSCSCIHCYFRFSFSFFSDIQPPLLKCPAHIATVAIRNENYANVTWPEPFAKGTCEHTLFAEIFKINYQEWVVRQYRRKVRQSVTDGLPFRWPTNDWQKHWNTDGITVYWSDFRPSPESSLGKSKTTHYINLCVTALRLMWYDQSWA